MKNKMIWITLICLVLGVLSGLSFPQFMNDISFIGTIYINLLKFIMIPVVMSSIIVTIYNSKKLSGKIILKSIGTFIIMFVVTFLLTSIIVFITKPGSGFEEINASWSESAVKLNVSSIIVNLFPSNIAGMIQSNALFATIIFSIFFGLAATKVDKGEKVVEVIDGAKQIFFKLVEYIMYLTPVATFSLVGAVVANNGEALIGAGVKYIGIAYLCSICTLVLVMVLPVWIDTRISPVKYIKGVLKVWITTMTTCSSVATLPTTIKTCKEEFNVPDKITDIVVPLGCTIHMCGGAVSFALLGCFCMQMFNITMTPILFAQMILSATIINMAAPGIPNGGVVIGATYLSLLGIPLDFIGFYSGIYKLLDMAYTTLNVTGDITANLLISKSEE